MGVSGQSEFMTDQSVVGGVSVVITIFPVATREDACTPGIRKTQAGAVIRAEVLHGHSSDS